MWWLADAYGRCHMPLTVMYLLQRARSQLYGSGGASSPVPSTPSSLWYWMSSCGWWASACPQSRGSLTIWQTGSPGWVVSCLMWWWVIQEPHHRLSVLLRFMSQKFSEDSAFVGCIRTDKDGVQSYGTWEISDATSFIHYICFPGNDKIQMLV